jgi:hypothetical protein
MFNTHQADGTPATLDGTPTISVYKDGGANEDNSGVTLITDFDTGTGSPPLVGLHCVTIDTSTDATFYSAGSDFTVVITSGTVDSISVALTVVGSFSINNRTALRSTIAGRELYVDVNGHVLEEDDGITAVGTVGTVTGNGEFTLVSDDLSTNNDDYNSMWLVFTSGNNAFVPRVVTDYVGASKTVLFTGAGMKGAFPQTVQPGDTWRLLAGSP